MFKLRYLVLLVLSLVLVIPAAAQDSTTVKLGNTDAFGNVLVGPNDMTLYIFTRDSLGEATCYDKCAEAWPPLTVDSADNLTSAEGIPGELGTVERTDGTLQVTYNGLPLYYFAHDEAVGDTNGQAVGNAWWVVAPATVYVLRNDELGHILVGPTGMSLYRFTKDEMDTSNCYDQCAQNWPPLLVDDAMHVVGDPRLPGELGTTDRTDGTIQVTYNGSPLYYWKDDAARGDVNGEGVGDSWYTISPETVTLSHSDDLGDFLVAGNGMTVYRFENDEMNVSNCSGDCLDNWPALTLYPGDRLVAGAGIDGELGTITRDDGSAQVTYNGMPLYFFARDEAPGDTNGQEVGDVWYVVAP